MQILFERSGGFTGIPVGTTLDTNKLPHDEVVRLRQLIEAADFFSLPAAPPDAQPDRSQYKVTIQERNRRHRIIVSEASLSSSLKPLIDWLVEAARKY